MPVIYRTCLPVVVPQKVDVIGCACCVALVRVICPFQIAQRPFVPIAAAVLGAGLKCLPDVVRHHKGQPTRSTMEEGCLKCQAKIMLGGHVINSVMDKDDI